MADTKAQIEAEKWMREVFLPQRYGRLFHEKNLDLRSKGQFRFDAVSDDGEIAVLISTSVGFTSTGKPATSKLMKIRSDAFWFLMLERQPERKIMIFTDQSMMNLVNEEKKKGRFPPDFEILKVELPDDVAARVFQSQKAASLEMSPTRKATE